MDTRSREELTSAMKELTNLDNPNSVAQMKTWLSEHGLATNSLDKKAVAELMKTAPPELTHVLSLRQQLAKSSVRKYQAMETTVCADSRARGMFQFYGASRTGRFSGRHIQLQNLPQNHLPDLANARALVRSGDFDAVSLLYEDVPDTLSQLIRTAFIPREGTHFLVADFSAIEARVIAWFAGESWRQKVFAKGGDIYCASASQMFKVPVEKHGINGHLRQKGKIAELALGYGGSVGALKAMGALDMGLSEDELPGLVDAWRQSNPNIVKFWWDVDQAVMEAVKYKHTTESYGLIFSCRSGMLFITLPSGRKLAYVKPRIGTNKFGGSCITYEGIGSTKKWVRLESYGPKFVENIVQATARDILLYAMKTLRNCSIVMHIHDELVIEADPRMSLDAVCEQMGRTPPWAKGLLLRADGYVTPFYKKD
jgi:DNA polymerase bacteriophage-type